MTVGESKDFDKGGLRVDTASIEDVGEKSRVNEDE